MILFRKLIISLGLYALALFCVCLPRELFMQPVSPLLYSADSTLLGGRIAADGQWRFPSDDTVCYKFAKAITAFEDKRFYYHPGIDPVALCRAVISNLRNRKVTSGASTITMQVIRLSRGHSQRSYKEKIIEMIMALRLEFTRSKDHILSLYCSNAPFGGNIVGIETASRRYFGHSSASLSWAEAATLAVLPNSPSLIHLNRNRSRLLEKRNRLLLRLYNNGDIDASSYEAALIEPLPSGIRPLPDRAPHLFASLLFKGRSGRIYTDIDSQLQLQVSALINNYARRFESNYIYNVAAVVADVNTGKIISYVGNVTEGSVFENGRSVDLVSSPRSTGSILKPILYAAMLDEGLILPESLVSDIPLYINGFSPQNYNKDFSGVVRANEAVARSLNVPLVRMLVDYQYSRFYDLLKNLGVTTLNENADHYGTSIILGGAEATLYDMVGIYTRMACTLKSSDVHTHTRPLLSRASIWYAFQAMSQLNRPEEEAEWSSFESMKKVAWKTGTSFGGRDAWSIGVTPGYVVGVWVGNATCEGRAGVTGVGYAAPIMFDIFSYLPSTGWFEQPREQMQEVAVCRRSGFRAGEYCPETDTLLLPAAAQESRLCPFHKKIFLDPTGRFQATTTDFPRQSLIDTCWFVLSPAQEWYFRRHNPQYSPLPPSYSQPQGNISGNPIEIIYPQPGMKICIPEGFSGKKESMVAKASHSSDSVTLFWHLNGRYLGQTRQEHIMAFIPDKGRNVLLLTDEKGNRASVSFSAEL